MQVEALRDAEAVALCNHVLATAGLVATVASVEDVRVVCASTGILVAAFEAILGKPLEGIERQPASAEQRVVNTNALILELQEGVLKTNLEHISGTAVVKGDIEAIRNLLEILSSLSPTQRRRPPPRPKPAAAAPGKYGRAKKPRPKSVALPRGALTPEAEVNARLLLQSFEKQHGVTIPEHLMKGFGAINLSPIAGAGVDRYGRRSPRAAGGGGGGGGKKKKRKGRKRRTATELSFASARASVSSSLSSRLSKESILPPAKMLDSELARKIEELDVMKRKTRQLMSGYQAVSAARMAETKQRIEERKELWMRSRHVQRQVEARRAQERRKLAERGLAHSAKVEKIKAAKFQDEMHKREVARKARQVETEARVFKEIFREAVAIERARLLDERKQEQKNLTGQKGKVMMAAANKERKYVDHFEMLERKYLAEQRARWRADRAREQIQRDLEQEAKVTLTEQREALLVQIDHQEEAAYLRSMDPKLIKQNLLDRIANEIGRKAARM